MSTPVDPLEKAEQVANTLRQWGVDESSVTYEDGYIGRSWLVVHLLDMVKKCVDQRDKLADAIAPFRHTPEDRCLWETEDGAVSIDALVSAAINHRDNTPESWANQSEDTAVVNAVTAAMREADRVFEKVGGSTRHHVRDCLLPVLNCNGWNLTRLTVEQIQEVEQLRAQLHSRSPARPPALQALIDEMQSVYFQTPNVGDVVSRDMVLQWADRLSRLLASVSPPEEQAPDLQADVKEAIAYVNKIVVESDGYPMMHEANHLRTLLINAWLEGKRRGRLASATLPQEEQDQRITEIREHLRNAEIVKRTLDRAGATPFLTTYYVEDVAYLLAVLSPTAPKDVLDSLHQVFTRNGISSYIDHPNIAGDIIHWACEMYRQSKMPPRLAASVVPPERGEQEKG